MTTPSAAVFRRIRAARPLERRRVVADPHAGKAFGFRFVRRAGGGAAEGGQVVARVDQHRERAAPAAGADCRGDRPEEGGCHQAGAVIGDQDGVAARERCERRVLERARGGGRVGHVRGVIDADHLLPCRVRAAGKDAGLHRRAVAGRADQVRAVDPPVERAEQAAVAVAAADEAGEARVAAEGGDVAGGVRRPPGTIASPA